jgi:hypothetical protein
LIGVAFAGMEEIVIEECCELENAVLSGDDQRAVESARKLAESKSQVTVTLGNSALSPPDKHIRLIQQFLQILLCEQLPKLGSFGIL